MTFTNDFKTGINPYKERAREVIRFLAHFAKNPVQGIRHLPNWDWGTLLVTYASLAAISGILAGLISLRLTLVISGFILAPIWALFGGFVLAGFFYYTFMFVFQREVAYKLIFTIVMLALLPFFVLNVLAGLLSAVKLVGLAASAALLVVGLSENTSIERHRILKIIAGLYLLYFLFWGYNMIAWQSENRRFKDLATPESYEKLKEEFED